MVGAMDIYCHYIIFGGFFVQNMCLVYKESYCPVYQTMTTVRNKAKRRTATYTRKHFDSNDGMLTTVWGPSAWHLLHTISFNYPVHPTCQQKREYRDFVLSLGTVLPCGKCRKNLRKNFAKLPLRWSDMDNRTTFSKYIYKLHEVVNTMLHKKSGLTYNDVRERYEHFRARCALPFDMKDVMPKGTDKDTVPKENGCTEPLYGEKSKCVLQILPQSEKCETFQIDEKCIKRRQA